VLSIKKLKYIVILPLILAGCGVSVRLYNKITTDTKVTPQKLAILAPFVAANYPTKETFIVGKSDTTTIHDTTLTTAIIYDTITKRYDSIKIKQIVVNRLIIRIDTIRVKEVVDCYAIGQRLAMAEAKVQQLKNRNNWIIIIDIILLLIIIIIRQFNKKW
jgi:hypothetical protein